MTALKAHRRDLSAHLAAGLSTVKPITDTALGAQVNAPSVIVQPASGTYVTVEPGYCSDGVDYAVTIYAPPGDLEAQVDALDDYIDAVRSTLRSRSPGGHKFALREISGMTRNEGEAPFVIALVHLIRETP